MKQIYVFFVFLISAMVSSQEVVVTSDQIISVADVIEKFETTSDIRFSYDVTAMEHTYIIPKSTTLKIRSFLKLLRKEVAITNKLSGSNIYRLVKSRHKIEHCIRVLDQSSRFEIEEALIQIQGGKPIVTSKTGEAYIKATLGTKITVSYDGKNEKEVVLSKNIIGCKKIYLESDATTLNEVIIDNYLTKGLKQNTNGSLELKPSELGILPGLVEPDILQSLQLVPGISSPNENPAALNIRGGTPDQNLVLWDGIKMYQTGHFFNQISAFNPYIIDKVAIYKGGTSVQYGDRLSGVIDITSTDDLFNEEFSVGFNLTALDFYLKTPINEKLGVLLSWRRSITDIAKSFTFNSLENKVFRSTNDDLILDENNEFANPFRTSFSDFNFKLVWKPSTYKKLKLSSILVIDEFNNDELNTSDEDFVFRPVTDRITQSNFGTSITYTDNSPKRSVKKAQAYISSYFTDYTLESNEIDENNEDQRLFLERYDYILDIGYDASIKKNIGENNHLLIGQQSSYKNITNIVQEGELNSETPFQIASSLIPSVLDVVGYGEYGFTNKRLNIVTGLRAGYYNNFETPFIEPRLFGSYQISNTTRLTASLERKNQSISQLYAPQREPRLFQVVPLINLYWSEQRFENDRVRLLRSDQSTLGIIHNHNGWILEGEAYYKKVTGLSPFSSDLLTQILVVQDRTDIPSGESTRYGFDLLAKKKWNNYRVWAGLSVAQNKTTFKDFQDKSFTPPIDQQLRINFSQTYVYKSLEFGMGWTFASGLSITPLDTGSNQEIDNTLLTIFYILIHLTVIIDLIFLYLTILKK